MYNSGLTVTEKSIDINSMKFICKKDVEFFFRKYKDNVITGSRGRHIYIDNGSKILAVAHLDTVVDPRRTFNFNVMKRESDTGKTYTVIKTPTLDDRLGVFTILELMPKYIGSYWADILLTEGEESGNSTAKDFTTNKKYNWIVEFDRKGSYWSYQYPNSKVRNDDAVLYEYDSKEIRDALNDAGFEKTGRGSFTDICELEDLGCKGFNVAVGYHDNHSTKAFMYMVEYVRAMNLFINFYNKYKGIRFEHEKKKWKAKKWSGGASYTGSGVHGSYYQKTLASGWFDESEIKPGDIVEYLSVPHRAYIVSQVHKVGNESDPDWKYDLCWLDGSSFVKNVSGFAVKKASDFCILCLSRTHSPIEIADSESSTVTFCPECYFLVTGDLPECDFCGAETLPQNLTNIGHGHMSCGNCLEFMSQYEANEFIIPGDIVVAKLGKQMYEVIDIVDNEECRITLRTLDGEKVYTNGDNGFKQELFTIVSKVTQEV